MQLEFIPVEEFYFALTLAVRTLELDNPDLVQQMRSRLKNASTLSLLPSKIHLTTYFVFITTTIVLPLMLSRLDWQDKLLE